MISIGVIPEGPRFYQRAEGSPVETQPFPGDPSLRLKNGYARDDAIEKQVCAHPALAVLNLAAR